MRKHIKQLKNQKGMTLVELLAVLVILGIVAAIAVPMIGNVIENSKEKGILADAASILSGAQLAHANNEVTAVEGVYTFDESKLIKYVEGIDFASDDITASVSFDGTDWEVTYSELTKVEGQTDNKIKSDELNKLLKQ